jgi:hypothetical protein
MPQTIRVLCAAALCALLAPQLCANFAPTVPLLELKQVDDEWTWHRGKDAFDASEENIATLWKNFAAYEDKAKGWKGLDKHGNSTNLAVIHVDAKAPTAYLYEVLSPAADYKVFDIAVAVTQHIGTRPDSRKAPRADKLDKAYSVSKGERDEGKAEPPPVPKEQITVFLTYDTMASASSFVVAIDARGRKPIEDSRATTGEVILDAGLPAEKRKEIERKRKQIIDNIAKAVEDYIIKSGADIEEVEIVGPTIPDDSRVNDSAPWVFSDMAWLAVKQVNTNRDKQGLKALKIVMPFHKVMAMLPPPELPPKNPVEYPKDEPEEVDPSEDERIIEDPEEAKKKDSDNAEGGKGPFSRRRVRSAHDDRVRAALDWLKDHQHRGGNWRANGFSSDTTRSGARKTFNAEFVEVGRADGETGWEDTTDVGLTGLALLAFAGAGFDHKDGDYRAVCRQAILYLRKMQDNDGCFGLKEDDHFVYNHAYATQGLAEIYGLSGDKVLKPVVDKAVEFILKAQNPGLGWRYGVRAGINDSSVTTAMVMALHSAKLAGLEVDMRKSFADAAEWFKLATVDVNNVPRTGYDMPGGNNARLRDSQDYENNPAVDAMYVMAMLSMGKADLDDKIIQSHGRRLNERRHLPEWEHHKIDFYYWYYASLACHQLGGEVWKTWNRAVSMAVLDHQRGWHDKDRNAALTNKATLDEHGSWDPVGAWGPAGGRVYSTALGALILTTENRYEVKQK